MLLFHQCYGIFALFRCGIKRAGTRPASTIQNEAPYSFKCWAIPKVIEVATRRRVGAWFIHARLEVTHTEGTQGSV